MLKLGDHEIALVQATSQPPKHSHLTINRAVMDRNFPPLHPGPVQLPRPLFLDLQVDLNPKLKVPMMGMGNGEWLDPEGKGPGAARSPEEVLATR